MNQSIAALRAFDRHAFVAFEIGVAVEDLKISAACRVNGAVGTKLREIASGAIGGSRRRCHGRQRSGHNAGMRVGWLRTAKSGPGGCNLKEARHAVCVVAFNVAGKDSARAE